MKASTTKSSPGMGIAIATLFAILATLTINVLSNFFPLKGANIGEISNTILQGVQITPANYAFAIWGLIYIGLIAYGIYQLRPTQRRDPTLQRVDILLIVACVAQIIWVYLFTMRFFWLSVVAMLVILLALIGAYLKLGVGKVRVLRDRLWLAHIPLSIYLGWISVATIVNIASALYISNWDGWGISSAIWTAIVLVVATAIAGVVAIRTDIAFSCVFIWAYIAIAIRHIDNPIIWITAVLGAIVLGILLIFSKNKTVKSIAD
jgi:hypothetical protein